jgi:hypothetical protein
MSRSRPAHGPRGRTGCRTAEVRLPQRANQSTIPAGKEQQSPPPKGPRPAPKGDRRSRFTSTRSTARNSNAAATRPTTNASTNASPPCSGWPTGNRSRAEGDKSIGDSEAVAALRLRWGVARWRRHTTRRMTKLFGKKPQASRHQKCPRMPRSMCPTHFTR